MVLFAKCVWEVVAMVVRKAGVTKGHNSPDRIITAITVRDPYIKRKHYLSSGWNSTNYKL